MAVTLQTTDVTCRDGSFKVQQKKSISISPVYPICIKTGFHSLRTIVRNNIPYFAQTLTFECLS